MLSVLYPHYKTSNDLEQMWVSFRDTRVYLMTFLCKHRIQKSVELKILNKKLILSVKFIVKNKYTKMYLQYIYFMVSTFQIHLHFCVLNKNTLQLYF